MKIPSIPRSIKVAATTSARALSPGPALAALLLPWLMGSMTARAGVIADVRADFQPAAATGGTTADFGGGLGLPDSAATGHWNFLASATANPAQDPAPELLDWRSIGYSEREGYACPVDNLGINGIPAVAITKIFEDGTEPAANQVAWHPGLYGPYPLKQ